MGGNQQFLTGEFFGTWQAWDGIRALDYLLTRPEVDPQRVGITGNSGGGTLTTWLAALDSRWTMAAPSCFVTTIRRNLENELPADTEQCPPHALALGLDHADFLAALAPKPITLLSQERDYFDVRGAIQAKERLQHLYRLLEVSPELVQHYIGPEGHGFHQGAREAMYASFMKTAGLSGSAAEPPFQPEKDEALWCTPRGQVSELNSRTISSFTREMAEQLAKSRSALKGADLKQAVTEILKLPTRKETVPFRILRPRRTPDYPYPRTSDYLLETEPGLLVNVYRNSTEGINSRPPRQVNRAILYVAHDSIDAELKSETFLREICKAEPNATLYALDVRGLGESKPNTCGENSYDTAYGCDYFYAIHSLMLDRPYVGQRTHDVLSVLDWLREAGHTDVHLTARGYGAIPATYAALLHDSVAQVTLKNALISYQSVVAEDIYRWPLSSLTPDVLQKFDLPDVYRELKTKKLRQIEPWDAQRHSG
ncbi:MAG: prolyl oligopeptidase family serine peptidase [Planctomycetales bacterium]